MMNQKVEEAADFISDLPPPILHHILSYLSSEETVRTSVLSKKWNSVQKSFPVLEFSSFVYLRRFRPRLKERLHEYLYSVDRSLQNFVRDKLCIQRLSLHQIWVDRGSVPLVNTWLPLALHNGVSDLTFHVNIDGKGFEDDYYPLPETTFTVSSSLLRGSSEFFLLKKLELSDVFLTEKIVQDIIRNCPHLTDLSLTCIHGLENLNISKKDKLVSLTIKVANGWEDFKSIFVDAPSLQSFILVGVERSLPYQIDLTSCSNMRELDLCDSSITDDQFNMHISRFPLLEILGITYCRMLRRMRISLRRLKHLKIDSCDIKAIEIDAPILSEFVFTRTGSSGELPVLVLADAISGSMHLIYRFHEYVDDGSFLFLKIREFFSVPFKSKTFELNLGGLDEEISSDPNDFRERVTPPPVEIDRLVLTGRTDEHLSYLEAFLDGLLWSCHPKEIRMAVRLRRITPTSIKVDNCVKTLCRMLKRRECELCSDLSHCKCWRSRFKAATIESFGTIKFDEINVRSFAEGLLSDQKYWRRRCRTVQGNLDLYSAIFHVMFRFDWEI